MLLVEEGSRSGVDDDFDDEGCIPLSCCVGREGDDGRERGEWAEEKKRVMIE